MVPKEENDMREKILEVKHLGFSYDGKTQALSDVSVSIYQGERIAVLGANGAGKSTFFLHLNGVRQGSTGTIFLDGEAVESKKQRKKLQQNVGIVFQDADSQMIASTVKAEVAFGPMNMGISKTEVEKNTMDAITQMKLQDYVDRPPHYLSGGEKKRVGIADILAMKPRIIVFDEPTAALDPASAKMLEDTLSLLEQEGKTILLSTHDVDFAYRFAKRILVFYQGTILADDTPRRIFQNEELLQKTNLKKPVILTVYELLKERGLVTGGEIPKNVEELAAVLP